METANTITIRGEPSRTAAAVYALAADLAAWPSILPHYRYLRVLEETPTTKLAEFGASRDGIPVQWTAKQELFPEERRITFVHVAGITRTMWVEWRIEPREWAVEVTILHRLSYPPPVLGDLFARWIVGRLFVENIAGKTLRCFRDRIESEG